MSLPSQLGPALQLKVGEALAGLRTEGVLLIGSGSITHNLGELDWHAGPDVIEPWALAFRDWVVEKLTQNDRQALLDYRQQAPFAVRNHPSDEHLLPLFFALGLASGLVSSIKDSPWGAWDGHLSVRLRNVHVPRPVRPCTALHANAPTKIPDLGRGFFIAPDQSSR